MPAIILGQGLNTSFNVVKLALANDESVPSRPFLITLILGDWTAFIPPMRGFLKLNSINDASLKLETVPLSDIELVTNKTVKIDTTGIRRKDPTARENVQKELNDLYQGLGNLNEVDWTKIRDMAFNEDRTSKRVAIEKVSTAHSIDCPSFLEHVLSREQNLIIVCGISRRISRSTEN